MKYEEFLFRPDNEGGLIVDYKQRRVFTTNRVGYFVISSLRNHTTEEIINNLCELFPSIDPDRIKFDVENFLNCLHATRRLTPDQLVASYGRNTAMKASIQSSPILLNWDVTCKCNLRCIHCYGNFGLGFGSPDPTLDQCINLIDEFEEMGILALDVSGGEPLLRKDILKILSYAAKKDFHITLRTNGTLITPEVAKELCQCALQEVVVSLDGDSAEVHERIRGTHTFEKTVNGIKNLVSFDIPVAVNFVYWLHNIDSISSTVDLCKRLGVDHMNISPILPVGRGRNIKDSLFTLKDVRRINKHLRENFSYLGDFVRDSIDEGGNWKEWEKYNLDLTICEAGSFFCVISTDLKVFPCRLMSSNNEMCLGTLEQKRIKEIWDSESAKRFREILQVKNFLCGDCTQFFECKGPCPALSLNKYGSLVPPIEGYENPRGFMGRCYMKSNYDS